MVRARKNIHQTETPTVEPSEEPVVSDFPEVKMIPYNHINKFYGNPNEHDEFVDAAKLKQMAREWLSTFKEVMIMNRIPTDFRIHYIRIGLRGSAHLWLSSIDSEDNSLSWNEFQKLFNKEYCNTSIANRQNNYSICQLQFSSDDTVPKFNAEFERLLLNRETPLKPDFVMDLYLIKLPSYIRKQIENAPYSNYHELKQAAERVEKTSNFKQSHFKQNPHLNSNNYYHNREYTTENYQEDNSHDNNHQKVRRLNDQE